MYMNERDIKALKILVKGSTSVRNTPRKLRAINQISRLLVQNERKIQQQRKTVKRMTATPKTTKNNKDIWG